MLATKVACNYEYVYGLYIKLNIISYNKYNYNFYFKTILRMVRNKSIGLRNNLFTNTAGVFKSLETVVILFTTIYDGFK